MKRELWRLIYVSDDRVHLLAARIIGYAGCTPSEFWAAAKKLPNYDQQAFDVAVRELTRFDRRECDAPRYELCAEGRLAVRVLLGPAPEDAEHASYWAKDIVQAGMAEPHAPAAGADGGHPGNGARRPKPPARRG
jgi:hypothetical protein